MANIIVSCNTSAFSQLIMLSQQDENEKKLRGIIDNRSLPL